MNSFVNFWVDEIYTTVPRTFTVLQGCSVAGVEVPRFCYHEKLSIAGNCRMCLVEVNNSKKLIASCAVPVSDNLKVYTNNLRVKKARESVLEFLLANHPLDCPICDQGGECDLQDITISFGSDRGRFYEVEKRAVEDKYCGPLVKTVMTRCIHCTRCIRFISEVSGYPDLGTTGRGTRMEVGTYISKALSDELSANIIDLCPVGALTSKPYSFTSRPWELNNVESIDVFDILCSNIMLSVYGNKIKRILPRINESLNEDWISNKARFIYDSFDLQRISFPLLNLGFLFSQNFSLWAVVSWKQIMASCVYFLNKFRMNTIFGPHLDLETISHFKSTFLNLGLLNSFFSKNDYSAFYLSSIKVKDVEKYSTFFSINSYLRNEIPLLNSRVRKSNNYFMSNFKFFSAGSGLNYFTYPVKVVSNNTKSLNKFFIGKHTICKSFFSEKKSPIIFYKKDSMNLNFREFKFLFKPFFIKIETSLSSLMSSHLGLNFLHTLENTLPVYSIGFETNYDYVPLIYQGHHGTSLTAKSTVVMPTAVFAEKSSTYLNLEGLIQKSHAAVSHSNFIKKDWEVFKALIEFYNFLKLSDVNLISFNNLNYNYHKLTPLNYWLESDYYAVNYNPIYHTKNHLFSLKILNYYWNDLFSQNSKIMAKCASLIINNNISYK